MRKLFLDFRNLVTGSILGEAEPGRQVLTRLVVYKKQIIESIHLSTMGFGRSGCVRRQMQQLQKQLVLLSDLLYPSDEGKNSSSRTIAIAAIIEILETLNGSTFFNSDQKAPLYLIAKAKATLRDQLPQLRAAFKKANIEPKLQAVILEPFNLFEKREQSSYHTKQYLLMMMENLIPFLQGSNASNDKVINLLFGKGFNTAEFENYYKLKITEDTKSEYNVAAQFGVLYDYERILYGITKYPQHKYDHNNPLSRTSLLKFVRAETHYLAEIEKLTKVEKPKATLLPEPYRIKTSLSVDGLAYLLRLLVEAKVIEASPRTQLVAFMASHVITSGKQEGNISADSLYTKYRQVTQTTATGIKSLLKNMAKQVESDFDV